MTNDPLKAFETVSGIIPFDLRVLLSVIFVAGLLLLYAWAIQSGFKGFVKGLNGPLDYLFLILKGVALIACVVTFFIY
ncbi:DUF3262 family protein [Phocoenobacter skyensis]|uniref:DUF3262 family protein n=1 Tax=Phocoenobacter skyensis TaxID=97481 RepID=UPI00276B97E4|nr:DUF3262 family protein [Pasteurella skyensis]MDP8185316.1 DUF3262 family protein [Pasteurella skyensis]